jgi:hypothetical protein
MQQPKILGINALRVDSIEETHDLDVAGRGVCSRLPDLLRFMCKLEPRYVNGQPRVEVFWRTFISDCMDYRHPAPESTGVQLFRMWLIFLIEQLAKSRANSDDPNGWKGSYVNIVEEISESLEELMQGNPAGPIPSPMHVKVFQAMLSVLPAHQQINHYRTVGMYELAVKLDLLKSMLFRTRSGLVGKGWQTIQEGDEIWIIPDVPMPMVLRNSGQNGRFRLVGQAYVHGIMHGEAVEREGLQTEEIELE